MDISAIVEETRAAFKPGKTLPIARSKEQLRQFWKLVDVRGTRTQGNANILGRKAVLVQLDHCQGEFSS